VLDRLEFIHESFTYNDPYTSNIVVKKDDIAGTTNDRFIVTYNWKSGEGPDLSLVKVQDLLNDAVVQVNTVMPGEIST